MTTVPEPSPDAAAHSARVAKHIRERIVEAGGWLPFRRYMELALYAPGLGYYAAGATKLGAAGDFVTAPEISPLFGATLAAQVRQVLAASAPAVLEFGAGSGRLAGQLLHALGDACARYAILEVSPDLRARQAEVLAREFPAEAGRVVWLERVPEQFAGCIIANEVLDAMPVHLIVWDGARWRERGVALGVGGAFVWEDRPAEPDLQESLSAIPTETLAPGTVTEVNPAAAAWLATLGACLDRGAALILDYGFPAAEYYHPQRAGGTLMCHTRHRAHADPLHLPGLTDITAHVDFSALAAALPAARLNLLGYATQASFLINCGITEVLARTPATDARAYLPLANQANRLLSPAEMGELFKVFACGRGVPEGLLGFARGDRRHTLVPCD